MEAELETLREQAAVGGYTPWLTEQVRINNVLGPDARSIHRWSGLVALLTLLLVCAPVFSFERKAGTEKLLRTAPKGRGPVLRRKYAAVCLEALAIWAILYLRQWTGTLDYIGSASLDAPIQNVRLLSDSPLRVTLKQFLALAFALRLTAMLVVGLLVAWISFQAKSWEQAVLAGAVLLLLPGVIYYFDQPWGGYISVLPMLTGIELLIPGRTTVLYALASLCWLAIVVYGSILIHTKWIGRRTTT